MQLRILNYLVEHGYVGNNGIDRPHLADMAAHFGRSTSLVRHEIVKLVKLGAVRRWSDEWNMPNYAFNPDWHPATPEEALAP
jgi:DNA-binding MarR family transcriptional regulator